MSPLTLAQASAIEHNGADLLISAGAGSGKTTTLTTRIVNKIINEGDDIAKKLIVTFTKEAANKLKSDITDLLADALSKANDDSAISHLQEQIVKVNSADISTIHSFCLKLVRANFDKLPLDSDFKIADENEIDSIKNEVMKEVVEELYEATNPSDDILIVSDFYSKISDSTSLDQNLLKLYQKLAKTSKFLDTLLLSQNDGVDFMQTVYGEFLIDKLLMLIYHYRPFYEGVIEEIKAVDGAPKYLDAFIYELNHINALELATKAPRYMEIKRILDEFKPSLRDFEKKSGAQNKELIVSMRKSFLAARNEIKNEYFQHSNIALKVAFDYNSSICSSLYTILKVYEGKLTERKRKYGICELDDIEKLAHLLLVNTDGTPTETARKIALDYNEIYIDEYQDTNSVQDDIFASISKSNRFMVGDVKQSIYRFRAAEPEIFSSYRDKFVEITPENKNNGEGKIIFMSENFRCDENIIKFSNVLSDYMFMPTPNANFKLGIPYSKEDRLIFSKIYKDKPGTNENCEVCIIDRSELGDLDKENESLHLVLQAKYVAKRIYDIKKQEGNGFDLSKIAILVRKRKYISYYTKALNELGINTEYIEKAPFYEKPHILVLLSLLNVIDNPYKEEYLIGALLSSVFNFTFDDLVEIREMGESKLPLYSLLLNYSGKNEKIIKNIEKFKSKLLEWQREIKKMNACEAVSYVMRASNLILHVNDEEKRDLIKFYNKAREYEKGSYKGLYKFLTYIESIKDTEEQEAVFTSPENCVKIMTTHTSKGLQFEYCFICNAEGEFTSMDLRDDILFNRHLGVAGYVGNKDGLVKYDTILRKISKHAIKKANMDEEMCLLYVAMTRAQKKLIITASVKDFISTKAKLEELAPYQSKLDLYSSKSCIEFIMKALASTPLSFVDYDSIELSPFLDSLNKAQGKEEPESLDTEKLSEISKILRERFAFKYKYEHLNKLPSKISVSRLKPDMLDTYENNEIDLTKALNERPKFMLKDADEVTGADKGTATHLFMQFCDFENLENNGYESELSRLVDKSFISQDDADIINKSHIDAFVGSSLFKDIKNSKMIKREFRFNVMLQADELTSFEDLKSERVLVQGVVDAVFVDENDNLVLVDYKTDKVDEGNYKNVLTARYKSQLSYYKKAIELIFERPVDKLLIYSVPLHKELEIE